MAGFMFSDNQYVTHFFSPKTEPSSSSEPSSLTFTLSRERADEGLQERLVVSRQYLIVTDGGFLSTQHNLAMVQITLASVWSARTNSCTDASFFPAWRFSGARKVLILSLGVRSTPRLSTGIWFNGFLRAFMIPGNDA